MGSSGASPLPFYPLPLLLIQKISSVLCVPDSLVYAADNTRDRKEVAFMSVDLLLPRFSSRKTSLLNPLFPDLPLADSPFLKHFIYLTALGLCCCAWAFSSCDEQGLLSSCDVWASHCSGFSCCRAQALEFPSWVVAEPGPSCPEACANFLDQGLNTCPLHWQVDS